jgi:farnesyl-diphosphate farnesyltransferase
MAAMMAAQQSHSDEKTLLESLAPAIALLRELDDADRRAVQDIVSTLSDGMEFDLITFPDESSGKIGVLPTMAALDHYTYLVAGCVGEFWTKMTYLHQPGILTADANVMAQRGIRFGKALQMTNVLRDCGKDLRIGRCYLPQVLLERFELQPEALLLSGSSMIARPLLLVLVRETLEHFEAALDYTLAIPGSAIRLRLASLWPIIIGLETLLLLVQNDQWLDPERGSKLPRRRVYQMIAKSVVQVPFDSLVRAWVIGLMEKVDRRLAL